MENQIKVSIIVPVYNAEAYLGKCLDYLINQTLKDIEIICINNSSLDNSMAILEKYAQKDSRIKIFQNVNNGPGGARNIGIEAAQGEFIGLCDSDDWIDLNFYEELYNAAKKYDAQIASANMMRVRKLHKKYRINVTKEAVYTDIQDKLNVCNITKMCYTTNKIYNKEALKATGIKFREDCFFEDVDYIFKVVYFLNKLVTVPSVFYYYRANPNSIVKTHSEEKEKNKNLAYAIIREFAKEHNIELKESDKLIGRRRINFLGFPILKIKVWEDYKKYYLFGFIKIAKVKEK